MEDVIIIIIIIIVVPAAEQLDRVEDLLRGRMLPLPCYYCYYYYYY